MSRPLLLDLFCCEGGAAVGYHRAGFDVVGVDLEAKYAKRYPYEFHQADAIEFAKMYGGDFDAIHASPPCQHASAGTRAQDRSKYPALIEPTREALEKVGKPYVIENVKGAALLYPIVLCGTMFDLTADDDDGTKLYLQRHRLFETNWLWSWGRLHAHPRGVQWAGSYGGARRNKQEAREVRHGGYVPSKEVQQKLLGIDWMTQYGMYQAVPPAYTKFVGENLLEVLP